MMEWCRPEEQVPMNQRRMIALEFEARIESLVCAVNFISFLS